MAKAITRSSSEQSVLRSVLAVTEREPTDEHEHCRRRRNAAKWKLAFQRSVSPLVLARGTRCSLGFLHSSGPTFRQRRAVGGVHPIATILSSSMTPSWASFSSGPVSPRVCRFRRHAGNTKLRCFLWNVFQSVCRMFGAAKVERTESTARVSQVYDRSLVCSVFCPWGLAK